MKDYVKRAQENYRKKAMRIYHIGYNKQTEPELVAWLDSKDNKADYIRQLILKDMGGQK